MNIVTDKFNKNTGALNLKVDLSTEKFCILFQEIDIKRRDNIINLDISNNKLKSIQFVFELPRLKVLKA